MTYDVQLSALAIEDLIALHQWVSGEADIPTADGYLARIEDRIAALADSSHRGSPRDDLVRSADAAIRAPLIDRV